MTEMLAKPNDTILMSGKFDQSKVSFGKFYKVLAVFSFWKFL